MSESSEKLTEKSKFSGSLCCKKEIGGPFSPKTLIKDFFGSKKDFIREFML